jgi:DNA-binding NarL/FixJ family response regulator
MRILILDTNKLFGVGIMHFLEASFPMTRVEYAPCYTQVATKLETDHIGLLLMELGTAKDNELSVLKQLRTDYPFLPILVLSEYPTDYYGPLVIRAGGCGFIEKDSEPEQLLWAVKSVLKGNHYISPKLANRLAKGLVDGDDKPLHEVLSTREFQVFRRLALGESVSSIARTLNLSVKTVDTHRSRILHKMGADKTGELAQYAFEQGLIPSRRLGEKGTAILDS